MVLELLPAAGFASHSDASDAVDAPASLVASAAGSPNPPACAPSRKRIAFLAHGTLGDYLPAALVCGQLSERGHDCIFFAPENAKPLIANFPHVRFADFGMSMEYAKQHTPEGQRLLSVSLHNHSQRLCDFWGVLVKDWVPRLLDFLKAEQPDLVVLTIGSLSIVGTLLKAMGVPTVSLLANPMHATGVHMPTIGPQFISSLYFRPLNRAFWKMVWFNHKSNIKPLLREALRGHPDLWNIIDAPHARHKQCGTRKLILCSPSFYKPPADWDPTHARVIGVTGVPDAQLKCYRNAEIESFMAAQRSAGLGVAYVGFGSMLQLYADNDRRLFVLNAVVEACLDAGLAVIVLTVGSEGFKAPDAEKVLAITQVPHGWLFPQCALVVHHGGSGTVHTAVRAGRPQVIVPFYFPTWFFNGTEQGFWKMHVDQAGLGSGLLHVGHVSKANVLSAIRKAMHPDVVWRAADMASKVRAEVDGLSVATSMVESMAMQGGATLTIPPVE